MIPIKKLKWVITRYNQIPGCNYSILIIFLKVLLRATTGTFSTGITITTHTLTLSCTYFDNPLIESAPPVQFRQLCKVQFIESWIRRTNEWRGNTDPSPLLAARLDLAASRVLGFLYLFSSLFLGRGLWGSRGEAPGGQCHRDSGNVTSHTRVLILIVLG